MNFKLKNYSLFELGQRTNQEDCIYPAHGKITEKDRVFILCDGMGGHEKGEVASQAVCAVMSSYLKEHLTCEETFNDYLFQEALSAAYDELDRLDNGAAKKMGTTLAFLKFHSNGCTLAHIGDSRIYHVRPSKKKIQFVTSDHSLMNDLIKTGNLTLEEAKNFKQKNVITRAMQPNQERRAKAELHHIEDIRPGDYFFICSDGMLEKMEDENLVYILSSKKKNEKKVEMLKSASLSNRDNHSMFLIHVVDTVPQQSALKKLVSFFKF